MSILFASSKVRSFVDVFFTSFVAHCTNSSLMSLFAVCMAMARFCSLVACTVVCFLNGGVLRFPNFMMLFFYHLQAPPLVVKD